MNATHTPGPWTVEGPHEFGVRYQHRIIGSHHTLGKVYVHPEPVTMTAADAALIAAAPTMLETLQLLEKSVAFDEKLNGADPTRCATGTTVDLAQVLRMCRAAIARAEGQS